MIIKISVTKAGVPNVSYMELIIAKKINTKMRQPHILIFSEVKKKQTGQFALYVCRISNRKLGHNNVVSERNFLR